MNEMIEEVVSGMMSGKWRWWMLMTYDSEKWLMMWWWRWMMRWPWNMMDDMMDDEMNDKMMKMSDEMMMSWWSRMPNMNLTPRVQTTIIYIHIYNPFPSQLSELSIYNTHPHGFLSYPPSMPPRSVSVLTSLLCSAKAPVSQWQCDKVDLHFEPWIYSMTQRGTIFRQHDSQSATFTKTSKGKVQPSHNFFVPGVESQIKHESIYESYNVDR